MVVTIDPPMLEIVEKSVHYTIDPKEKNTGETHILATKTYRACACMPLLSGR